MEPRHRPFALLRFIRGYQQAKGYGPSFSEMAAGIGLKSKGHLGQLIGNLEERGLIRRLANRNRAIEVLAPLSVPTSPQGEPLFVVPQVWQSGVVGGEACQRLVFSGVRV